jgi:hypothetical protein
MLTRPKRRRTTISVLLLLIAIATGAAAAPADARTYFVSGQQIDGSPVTMRGDLIGVWEYTSAVGPLTPFPLYRYTGTEHFEGCLNRHHDLSCRHDPKGTLDFSFDIWVMNAGTESEPVELWGACMHPITSGTGAFTGAQGVIAMIDTVTPNGVFTRYDGNLILPDHGDAPVHALRTPFAEPAAALLGAAPARRACGAA